jgi:hypothetical protein
VKKLLVASGSFRRFAVLVFAALMLMTTASVAAGTDEPFIQEPEKPVRDERRTEPFVALRTDGSMMEFYRVVMPDGSAAGVAIAETVRSGYSGIAGVDRLQGANSLEVYNALSEPGTRLPRELVMLYGKPVLGKQGWALPLPLTGGNDVQEFSCMVGAEPFGAFEDDILDKGYSAHFLSEKDGPSVKPNHWFDDVAPGDGSQRYKLQGVADNKTHFYGKVSYCYEDLYDQTTYHGRYVNFKYRISDFLPAWTSVPSTQLLDPGDSASFHFTPAPGVDFEFDFRMGITAAKESDVFHIGATWANPGGTLTSGH